MSLLLGLLQGGNIVSPPSFKTDGDVVMSAPAPTILLGASLAPAGTVLTFRPVQADYLPTPSVALLIGAKLAAAGSALSPPHLADFLPTPQPTLTRVPTAVTSIPFVAPSPKADDIPPQYPRLLAGFTLTAAGSIVASSPTADFLPTPLPVLTRAPTIVYPPILVSSAPAADPMPPQFSRFLQGFTLTAAGTIVAPYPVRADDILPQFPKIVPGFPPPAFGTVLAARPIRADDIPPQAPLLRSGALLAASGSILAPTPSADPIPPQRGVFLAGFAPTSAGAIVAPYPVRADDIAPVFPELIAGAKLTAAGVIVTQRPVRADDSIPPQFSALLRGFTIGTAGKIVAPSPTADFLPTPRPIFTLAPVIIYPTILVHPAQAADPIPLVFPQLLAGYALKSGTIVKANPVRADDSMIPVFPHLLAGYTLTAAGAIVKSNPVRADDVALATTTLVKGFAKATGAILAAPPVADFLPTPTPELLAGYTLSPAGSIVAPYPIRADDISPQFSTLIPSLPGATPLAAAGAVITSRPIRADDIAPQRSALLQGFLPPTISFIAFRPIRADDVVPQQGAFLHGTTITAAGTIVAPRPLRADDIPPVQLKIFSGFTLTSAGSIIASRPVRADDIAPQFPHLLSGFSPLAAAGRIVTAYPVRADDIPPQKTSFITPVVYPPAFLISPRPVRADDITPQFSAFLRGATIGKAGFVVAPAPAAPLFPAPPATILIGSLPLPPAGSIVAFRPIRADDVPPQFSTILRGYIYVPTPVGTSIETIFVDFPQLLWILEFEQSVCHIEYCDDVRVIEVNEATTHSVIIEDEMPTIVDRKLQRGDTLFFLDAIWQNVTTQQIFSIPVTDPITPPPGNSVPYNLTGVHIVVTIKNYVPDPDAAAVMQLDNQTLGGVSLISAIQGTFSVQGPATATLGLSDADIPLQLDIQIKTMGGAIFTVERGKLIVVPDITRSPS